MTYKEIKAKYCRRHGKPPVIQTCWIADVKERHGKTIRWAHNRKGEKPTKPCPAHIYPKLKALMKEMGEI